MVSLVWFKEEEKRFKTDGKIHVLFAYVTFMSTEYQTGKIIRVAGVQETFLFLVTVAYTPPAVPSLTDHDPSHRVEVQQGLPHHFHPHLRSRLHHMFAFT